MPGGWNKQARESCAAHNGNECEEPNVHVAPGASRAQRSWRIVKHLDRHHGIPQARTVWQNCHTCRKTRRSPHQFVVDSPANPRYGNAAIRRRLPHPGGPVRRPRPPRRALEHPPPRSERWRPNARPRYVRPMPRPPGPIPHSSNTSPRLSSRSWTGGLSHWRPSCCFAARRGATVSIQITRPRFPFRTTRVTLRADVPQHDSPAAE